MVEHRAFLPKIIVKLGVKVKVTVIRSRRFAGPVTGQPLPEGIQRDIAVPTDPISEKTVSIISPGAIGNWRVNDPVMTISPAFSCRPYWPSFAASHTTECNGS